MITIKRRTSNSATIKALTAVTKSTYDVNISKCKDCLTALMNKSEQVMNADIKKELQWFNTWLNNLTAGNQDYTNVKKQLDIIIEANNGISYVDSEDSYIDIHNFTYRPNVKLKSDELMTTTEIVTGGVCNNFRFFTRPKTRIVVLDYLRILDCIALYYAFRELGLTVEQIDSVLKDCTSAILNKPDGLFFLIKQCLGPYSNIRSNYKTLIQNKSKDNRDGLLYELVSELRISTDCYQLIHSCNEVETWQHHRVALKPKMTYTPVLDVSQKEFMVDLLNGLAIETENSKVFANKTKVIAIDNACCALSIPEDATITDLHNSFDIVLRLFNRQFVIPCKIYTYCSDSDKLIEEAGE